MTIQEKIEKYTSSTRRKLFDNQIRLSGIPFNGIHFYTEENKYGDTTVEVINHKSLEARIVYPGEIPLSRFRLGSSAEEVDGTGVFFFDILPIEIYTKWTDNVEKEDILFHIIKDEQNNNIPILLKVSEIVGSIQTTLYWKKSLCAPYNGIVPDEVQAIIDSVSGEIGS